MASEGLGRRAYQDSFYYNTIRGREGMLLRWSAGPLVWSSK